MTNLTACIETMFAENGRPLEDRIRAAADAGYPAVEIWEWMGKDLAGLSGALEQSGTGLYTLCAETWQDKCQLANPDSHDEFVRRVRHAADAAERLGAERIVVLAGAALDGVPRVEQETAVRDALNRAADVLPSTDMRLLLEVVNRQFEEPHALVASSETAVSLVRALDRPQVSFLYDRYHSILNGEAVGEAIEGNMHLVGHVQVADVPGRHELGHGAIDWTGELRWLLDNGYAGEYVGIEAVPTGDSSDTYRDSLRLLRAAEGR